MAKCGGGKIRFLENLVLYLSQTTAPKKVVFRGTLKQFDTPHQKYGKQSLQNAGEIRT
jgi:hypothetical protein